MNNDQPVTTTTINVTGETATTAPARTAAFQAIADMPVRDLAHFHWQQAIDLLSKMEHDIKDYGLEDSRFEESTAVEISEAVEKITASLEHIVAIANESAAEMADVRAALKASTEAQKLLTDSNGQS